MSDRYAQWAQRNRADCPSVDLLDAFRLDTLSEPEQSKVDAHLRVCAHCINKLIDLREFSELENAASAPSQLLDRVRRTTEQYSQGSIDPQPNVTPEPPASIWSQLRHWWQSLGMNNGLAGGVAAAVVVVLVLIGTQSQPDPLLNPDLVPRGQAVDEVQLKRLLAAIDDEGIAVTSDSEHAEQILRILQIDPSNSRGVALAPDTRKTARFTLGKPGQVGEIVIVAGAHGGVGLARLERIAQASWSGERDQTHNSQLMEIALLEPGLSASLGSAVVNLDLDLIGIVVVEENGKIYAVPPLE